MKLIGVGTDYKVAFSPSGLAPNWRFINYQIICWNRKPGFWLCMYGFSGLWMDRALCCIYLAFIYLFIYNLYRMYLHNYIIVVLISESEMGLSLNYLYWFLCVRIAYQNAHTRSRWAQRTWERMQGKYWLLLKTTRGYIYIHIGKYTD